MKSHNNIIKFINNPLHKASDKKCFKSFKIKKVKNLIFKMFTLNNLTYILKKAKKILRPFPLTTFVAIDFHMIK